MLATPKWLNQANFALIADAEYRHLLTFGDSFVNVKLYGGSGGTRTH
jgi:hypothetical protein